MATKQKGRAEETTTTLMTSDEKDTVRHAAFLSRQSVSAFIRQAAVKAAQQTIARVLKTAA